MSKIFMSYRRTDSMAVSGRIYDRLVQHFGRQNVFKDVDDIPPGEDFAEYIQRTLRASSVQLVIIGPHWLDAITAEGQLRLESPGDFVHIEVETALRLGLAIIPVLVDGAVMPTADRLPADLRRLGHINAVRVRDDPDFGHDMQGLVAAIERFSAPSAATASAPPAPVPAAGTQAAASSPPRQGRRISSRVTAAAAAALVVLALVSALVLHGAQGGTGSTLGGGHGLGSATNTATQNTSAGTASPSGTAGGFQITPVVPTATPGGLLPSGTIRPIPAIQLSCGGCDQPMLVSVTKITIDDTQQNMTWTFHINNHSGSTCEYFGFDDVELQDPSGVQHPGEGDATNITGERLSASTSVDKTAVFTFVPRAGVTYMLSAKFEHYGCGNDAETVYGPQPVSF